MTGSETSILTFEMSEASGDLSAITNDETGGRIDPDADGADTLTGLTQVYGGAGDDRITVTGNDVLVYGGEGADYINMIDAGKSAVYAGEGDTVQGSLSSETEYVLSDGVTFLATYIDSDVTVGASSDVHGDLGDDHLRTTGGDTALYGGAGDDTLDGAFTYDEYAETDQINALPDGDGNDTLDGGDGDDLLKFDHADFVVGGDGTDIFRGELTAGETAIIADFDPRSETIDLTVDGVDVTASLNEVQVVDNGAATMLQDADGHTFLEIQSATGLTIAFQVFDSQSGAYTDYVDANGDPIDPATADVTLRGFYPITN